MRSRLLQGACILGAIGFGAWAAACGGDGGGTANAKIPTGSRSEGVEHEACDEGGHTVQQLDATGDGKPDIKRVFAGNVEVCRISDLNHDGRPDLWEYFDNGGNLRRREADYDDNGVVNAIEYYENGKLVRKEMDTTGQHRIDTWDFFDASGKRIRRERDTTNDGRVDQWWTWDGDKITIAMDKSGDGKPDPEDTLVIGGDGSPVNAKDAKDSKAADGGAPATTMDASSPATPVASGPDAGDNSGPVATPVSDAGAPGSKRQRGAGGGKK